MGQERTIDLTLSQAPHPGPLPRGEGEASHPRVKESGQQPLSARRTGLRSTELVEGLSLRERAGVRGPVKQQHVGRSFRVKGKSKNCYLALTLTPTLTPFLNQRLNGIPTSPSSTLGAPRGNRSLAFRRCFAKVGPPRPARPDVSETPTLIASYADRQRSPKGNGHQLQG